MQNNKPTITLIPGSFSAPHAGHWDMIAHYAKISDYVIVFVGNPRITARSTHNSDLKLSADKSKRILELFRECSGLSNISIRISTETSPVRSVVRAAKRLLNCKIIFGMSTKDNKDMTWFKSDVKTHTTAEIQDPEKTAFKPIRDMSASDIRNAIQSAGEYKQYLPEFLSKADAEKACSLLWQP